MFGFAGKIPLSALRAAAAALVLVLWSPLFVCLSASPAGAAELQFAYDLRFEGVDGQLEARLREVSQLVAKKKEPPATLQGLRRRTQADRDVFIRLLRSRGYYDAGVQWSVDTAKKPVLVIVHVDPGARYRIARFDLVGLPEPLTDLGRGAKREALGITIGNGAVAGDVIEAERRLLAELAARAYPFARLTDRRVVIDRDAHTMEVTFVVDTGPQVRFGDVIVKGTRRIEPRYVENRMVFTRGELFDPERIEKSRKALFEAGVFSSVVFAWGELKDVSPEGYVPITVTVIEAKRRSIGAGVKYSSADGFGGQAFWENRNLFGGAEKLRAELEITQLLSTGALSFKKPDFLRPNLSLLLRAGLDHDDTDAYERQAVETSGGLEKRFSDRLVATAGLAFEQSQVTDPNPSPDYESHTNDFTLIGIPTGLHYDSSDNLLDPTRGQRITVGIAPYFDMLGTSVDMFILKGTESFYVPLTRSRRFIWATRFTAGSILGESRGNIPADKRFYAGGGDSVRGYKYQFVSPLDAYDNPTGGRSLLQVGTELRAKVTDTIGIVPFIEGAGVYKPSYPDFGEDFLWAAGLGLRYFTVAGPIRFDVGFPINGRPIDDIFQIYISLGQAF